MRASSVRRTALAAVLALGLAAPAAAESVSVRNCASSSISVRVYDNNPPNRTLRGTNWLVQSNTTHQDSCETPLCWVTIELWGGSPLGAIRSGLVCVVPYRDSIDFAQPPCSC